MMAKINYNKALKNIALFLKRKRIEKQWSQSELSFRLNLQRCNYQKIELQKVKYLRLNTVINILNEFDVSFEELIK
jgi:transcriptional regulator with XRE-family HTH domain